MTKKKVDKSLGGQHYQLELEDGGRLDVRPKYDSDEGCFTLEVRSHDEDEEIPLGRFLEPRGLKWPKIYNKTDLQTAIVAIFGETSDDLTDNSLEVAEWTNAIEITSMPRAAQKEAYNVLDAVYKEIIQGTLNDNAVESGDDLYLRFGSVLLKVTPRLVEEES